MRIIAIRTIKKFFDTPKYKDSEQALKSWFWEVKREEWKTPNDIKRKYKTASILKDNRVIFNIKGNKYRLVVEIKYELQIVYIRFVGTHENYNKIDAQKI